jgi:hypothetical protein
MNSIPKSMQGIFWSVSTENLDLERSKSYIIHQVLMYGDFKDIRWLFKVYPEKETKKVFLEKPRKVYTKEAFNYTKNFILGLDREKIPADKYVNSFYGITRP